MSVLAQADVLRYLREGGPKTMRELVDAFVEAAEERRGLEAQLRTHLLRLRRANMVSVLMEPEGHGKIWAAAPGEEEE